MSLLKTSLLLTPLVLLARGAAFAVPVLLAGWFGIDPRMDAFYYALGVPTFLLVVATSALSTVLIPLLAERPGLAVGSLAATVGAAAAGVGVAMAALLGPLLPVVTAFSAETRTQTTDFAWSLVPFVAVTAVAAVFRNGCEVEGRFSVAALGPLFRALGTLLVASLLRERGPEMLPIAMALGTGSEALWYAAWLGPRLGALPAGIWNRLWLVLPVFGGEALVATNPLVDRAFAATLAGGSVTMLEYADKVRLAPQTLLESTLVVVAFSTWAKLPNADRKEAVEQGLRQVLLLAPPILAGLAVGSLPLVRLLFERGAFDPAAVLPLSKAVAAFVPGVLGTLVGVLLVKAHVLAGRYGLVFLLGLGSSLLNAALNAVLGPSYGVVGIAGATSISTTVVALMAWILWVQKEGRGGDWLRALGAAAFSFLLGGLLWRLQPDSITDPRLWLAALPLVGMLGLGIRWSGKH